MFEAHPVPQNVTEFEFHLVGDMTIKQFVYLASGIGLAYLTFALLANKLPFLAYPLILIFAGAGAALAFLPIQERPLDHWIGAYFKAIFQPTKRSYKSKLITKEDPLFKTRLQVYLNSKRNPAVMANVPNNKTKSTPFSFSMTSIHQQDQQPAPAPVIATGPAANTQAAAQQPAPAQPKQPFSFSNSVPVPEVAPKINKAAIATPATQPQMTTLGSSSLSSIDIPQQVKEAPKPKPATQPIGQPLPQAPLPQPQYQHTAFEASVATPSSPVAASQPVAKPAPQTIPQAVTASTAATPIITGADKAINVPNPSEDELSKTIAIAKQVHEVQQNIIRTEEQINLIRSKAASQDANPKEYLDQFHQLLGDLQGLQAKAAQLSQEVALLTKEPVKPVSAQPEPVVKPKSIPTITLTSIANVINGIVTDSAGNYLDGAIILAHDKQGIPVRALKTNKLGQFVAATPLNNGIYTITIEKDTLVFDTIEIELTGSILKPILITAKPVAGGVAHG